MYRYPERMTRPANLAEAEAIAPGANPVYAEAADAAVDVETPAGERLAIDDPRLISLVRNGLSQRHDLTLLRSDRAMTDCRPVSIFSIQTVGQLSNETGIDMDKRRFRANIYIELDSGEPFGEDNFVGRTWGVGAKARIAILERDPRCKMITLDPGTAHSNPEVLRRLARNHEGKAGVYGAVLVEGTIRPGDPIAVLE
jgi:uncharacterized protein YcbX